MKTDQMLKGIDCICFDLFGTLIEITDRRRPFASMLRRMPRQKVDRFRRLTMTTGLSLAEINEEIEGGATIAHLLEAQFAIAREVISARLRPGVLAALRELPIPYGICSNLSPEYMLVLKQFADLEPKFRVLSCQVGCMKPDPAIYALVADASGLTPDRIMFVGDTTSADIDGPRRAGMKAVPIDDFLAELAE
ncbi:HAD family hydrolase [Pseudophaeobacter sp. TrK17]|uniref:HAD family hydrolase n=1 Tax=Pseudophaeobacter sp. TrK17 TaxID=2815167 RepID=UPI0035CE9150